MMASFDPGTVEISRWVIHEIPKSFRRQEGSSPKLSEALSPYDAEVARFFERKISDSFNRSKHEIQPAQEAATPGTITARLRGEDDLVELSIGLGNRLHQSQSGAMSGGLLVVMEGTHGEAPILSVLKLEKEEGARASSAEVEGKSTYSVEYLKDLFLTGRTRVFKVAVFALAEEDQLAGWVSDPQSKGSDVADFFLETFLECQLRNDPKVITRRFHAEAERFINERITDPEKKTRYETAVIAELNSNTSEVRLRAFADNNLDVEDRSAFVSELHHAGVEAAFVKDVQLVRSRIRRVQYEFEAGVKVSYPVETPADVVTVSGRSDGRTELQVVDELKNLHSRA
jgi:hypothetical protein